MSLVIYNTMTREKEPFVPAVAGEVRMYVCGVTPYDRAHIGHGRASLAFDVIRRYLVFRGYRVAFVQNFTDIEDKIIARAAQTGEPWHVLKERHIATYQEDMEWLGIAVPSVAPRATEHIVVAAGRPYRMVSLIERLVEKGVAYAVDGDVYFQVRRFASYGRLSGRALEDLRAGARVEVDERKRDPLDFALWKAAKPDEPRWPSPWGPGRPGWHIECSAMAMEYLGESFDIHGGGQDLIFPHHENEIAQSEAATGQPFARYWVHNGLVQVGAEKMSKSLGNMQTIADLRKYPREAVRLYLLGTHYRSPLEFWGARVDETTRALGRMQFLIRGAFGAADAVGGIPGGDLHPGEWEQVTQAFVENLLTKLGDDELGREVASGVQRFVEAMDDDFNTPEALGVLFELSHGLNRYRDGGLGGERLERFRYGIAILLKLGQVLGLLWDKIDPFEYTRLEEHFGRERHERVQRLAMERQAARERRDWVRADAIRAELEAEGLRVQDTPGGWTLWWKQPSTGR